MTERISAAAFDALYDGTPPWDTGRPQPVFVDAAHRGLLAGRILDVGCGSGELALFAASHGHDTTGIDLSGRAIKIASAKAVQRKLAVDFVCGDAVAFDAVAGPFDTILDSAFFHVLDDRERSRYIRRVGGLTKPGGRYLLLCCSDAQPGDVGPRRISRAEIESAFAKGWRIDSISPSRIETTMPQGPLPAWFACLTRN